MIQSGFQSTKAAGFILKPDKGQKTDSYDAKSVKQKKPFIAGIKGITSSLSLPQPVSITCPTGFLVVVEPLEKSLQPGIPNSCLSPDTMGTKVSTSIRQHLNHT